MQQAQQEMTLKDWIITMILIMIPIANIIMLIIWAADRDNPRNLFAKAYLIVTLGAFALVIIFYILIFILVFVLAGIGSM